MLDQNPLVGKVLDPQEGVVADVFAHNRGGIQRGKIADANGARVKPRLRVQHNGALIGIIRTRRGNREHGNQNVTLATRLEHQGLDLNPLATGKDIGDRDGADIRHGHRIVECLQFLVEFNDQIAIL